MASNQVQVEIDVETAEAIRELAKLNKAVKKTGKEGAGAFGKMDIALGAFAGSFAAAGLAKGLQLLGSAFSGTLNDALEFSKALAEVNSILPQNEKLTLRAKNEFIKFSDSFAGKPQQQAKAFYNIVSAGVQGTAKQLKTLEVANKAAVAGLVDIDTAAKVLVSSVNSYAQSGLTAAEASDILFVAVREGQTTFGELSSTLGSVAPLAANAGITFDELAGSLAFITKAGVSTDEAVTGLKAIITTLIKPAEEAKKAALDLGFTVKELGAEFSVAGIKQAGGFAKFLGLVREATKGNSEELGRLFGNVRAVSSVVNIAAGNFNEFRRILTATAAATGATDAAFEEISKSAAFQFERLVAQLQNLPQAFLVNFDEPIANAIKSIREWVGTNGILLVVAAVDKTISVVNGFKIVLTELENTVDLIIRGFFRAGETVLKFADAVLSANIATGEFLNLSPKTVEKLKNIRAGVRKNIQVIQESRKANTEAAIQRNKDLDVELEASRKFQKELEKGRNKQIEDNKIKNEQIAADDKKAFEDEVNALKERENIKRELQLAQDEAAEERAELKKIEQEFRDNEEFQRLSAKLGKEEALRVFFEAKQLKREGKAAEARKKLKDAILKQDKKRIKERATYEQLTDKERIANLKTTLGNISQLTQSNNSTLFAIGKAAATSQALMDTYAAANVALRSAPPPFNFALAALVTAAGLANVGRIASQKAPQKLQSGGIVEGPQFGDRVNARLNGGEVVLNRRQQENLFRSINENRIGSGSTVNVNISGDVVSDENFIDRVVEGINEGLETRNLQLRVS